MDQTTRKLKLNRRVLTQLTHEQASKVMGGSTHSPQCSSTTTCNGCVTFGNNTACCGSSHATCFPYCF
jgi:hypothetical protein